MKTNTCMPCCVSGWRVVEDQLGRIIVLHPGMEPEPINPNHEISKEQSFQFPMESHLRDFIARNIESIQINGHKLQLYQDQQGKTGIEYATGVGIIDILAEDDCGNLVVFELKLNRGADRVIGQILRYMGWLKMNVAGAHSVRGVIVTPEVDNKLRYAASLTPDILLFEYDLNFTIRPIEMLV